MHLGNGIICPVTGIPMIVVAGAAAIYAYKKAKKEFTRDKILPKVALTGLVFALQMINFSIPSTGSSGHIVGAILLAAILGPYTAFLAMCAILLVQAIFFADGGLLAIGCNIFNMGFLACFVAYPLIYKTLKNKPGFAAILASVLALQLGSIAVVIEGALSGSIELSSLMNFAGLMQAIHLPIGLIEGLVTASIIITAKFIDIKKFSYSMAALSVILAGLIAQYASTKPDGLEWSLLNISDSVIMQTQGILYNMSEAFQLKSSIFASLPIGGLAGLFTVGIIMYFLCIIIMRNKQCTINLEK